MSQEVKIMAGIIVATLLIVVGGAIFMGGSQTPSTSSQKIDTTLLIKKTSHQTAPSAKNQLVEFGDYQCPACGAYHPIVKKIIQTYGSKLTVVFRNYPLTQHKNARIAAEAAEAAGIQGKFWEMHDMIYENQDKWSESDKPLEIFSEYAKSLGIDVSVFQKDVDEKKYENIITGDQSDGNAAGVNSTPTFFLNGEKVDTNSIRDYPSFKTLIDSQLKK